MISVRQESVAKEIAKRTNRYYGFSTFPPIDTWYVGTKEELVKIGVVAPKRG